MLCTNRNFLSLLIFFSILVASNQIFAGGKTDSYDELLKTGSVEDVKKAFRNDNDMYRTRIGIDKDTILMRAIKYDRSESFVKLMIDSGVNVKAKNAQGQTALIYTCKYSSDDAILKMLLKKLGSKESVRKSILQNDKQGLNALDYARQNSSQATFSYLKSILPEEDWNPSVKVAKIIQTNEDEATTEDFSEEQAPNNEQKIQQEKAGQVQNQTLEEKDLNHTEAKNLQTEIIPQVPAQVVAPSTTPPVVAVAVPSVSVPIVESSSNSNNKEKSISKTENQNKTEKSLSTSESQSTSEKSEAPKTKVAPTPSSSVTKYERTYLYDYAPKEDEIISDVTNVEELAQIENPNQKDKNGRTPLMLAIKNGNDWGIRSLLKSGADVNAIDSEGWSALMYAIRYQNNLEFVNILIQNGANITSQNKYGTTPLQIAACYSDNPEILKRIILSYPSGSNEIFKAFILSITSNSSSLVSQIAKLKVFINRGLPMNRFYEGKTPLMYAAEYASSTQIIKLLLDSGAITSIRNSEGKTAFDYAQTNNSLEKDEIYWSLNNR